MFVAQLLKYYTFIFQMLIYFDSSRKSSFYKAVLNESGPISCKIKKRNSEGSSVENIHNLD